ncbi:hypothetical protein K1719_022695 [Acacia pycnantha]|nr:hypothetical protein K1719_022695 [Acacia pycnantha]
MDGRIDHSINSRGGGPYAFVLSSHNHHLIGSLLPPFQRRHVGAENLDHNIVEMLKECLDKHNCVVKHYRKAVEIIKENVIHDISIRLIRSSNSSGLSNQYNMPTTSELAALIVGDFDNSYTERDIIVKRQYGGLQRIDELHMAYLPLQYPLLFPYGDNGYSMVESDRLDYIRKHQKELMVDLYSGLTDALTRGETHPSSTGQELFCHLLSQVAHDT